MSDIISQTVIPAQPGFFRVYPYRDIKGEVVCRKDAVIAWVVTIEEPIKINGRSDPHRYASAVAVAFGDAADDAFIGEYAILRPDGMVEEFDQPVVTLDAWLADPDLLKRFKA